jgi:protoporphyrinogen/coproporphyrinogen III oxidase
MGTRAIVVGAGISGLSTAYYLHRDLGADLELTVLDSAPEPGGKVRTRDVVGLAVDTGPDAFLSRAPEISDLVSELGLGDEVEGAASSGAYVWSRGRLRPLPPGATFGLPERVWPLVRSGLISPLGAARAGMDVVLPRSQRCSDPTVEQLVRPRLGHEVYERMVEPLLGGVHAGSASVLSATSTVPEISRMAGSSRSMILAMRSRTRAARRATASVATTPRPALVSLRGGLTRLTSTLADVMPAGALRTDEPVISVQHGDDGWVVETTRGLRTADHVVLATPAHVTAALVEPIAPAAAAALRDIPYVDVASVVVAYRRSDVSHLPTGTGFLVPPVEGELLVGSTWLTSKWPHLVNDEVVVIRNLVGRYGDTRWLGLDDDELVRAVRSALSRMVDITAEPIAQVVQRWPAAMPQYTVGHGQRLGAIDAALAGHPGLHLTGAAYRGVGLAGCVAQSRALARTIVEGTRS